MRLAILCTVTLSAAAQAGVRLDLDTVDPRGGSGEQRMELQGDKVRVDSLSQEATASGGVNRVPRSTVIFDGTEMFTVDHRSRTYMAFDQAQANAQRERLKQMQANLPPEARAQFEQAMKQEADPAKVTFKKGSGTDRIAGFACTNYTELRNGAERGTVCLATWKAGPVKKEDLAGLVKFAQTMGAAEASGKTMLVNPEDWPGFPVSSQSNAGQIVRLKSAVRSTIPDNEFQPPADYIRKPLP